LGENVPRSQESLFDQRLFNQSQGLDSGFGDDEAYNVYDKRLFGGERERALYRAPKKDDLEVYGEGASLEGIINTNRFKPNKDFSGVDRERPLERDGTVQFEKDNLVVRGTDEAKLRIGDFFDEVRQKSDKKFFSQSSQPKNTISTTKLGLMHAVGGGSAGLDELRNNKSRKIAFEKSEMSGRVEENEVEDENKLKTTAKEDTHILREKDKERDREDTHILREKDKERDREKDKERDREKDRERERERPRERDRERDYKELREREHRERDREHRERDRDRDRERGKARDDHPERYLERNRDRGERRR